MKYCPAFVFWLASMLDQLADVMANRVSNWKWFHLSQSKRMGDLVLGSFQFSRQLAFQSHSQAPSRWSNRALSSAYSRVSQVHDCPDFWKTLEHSLSTTETEAAPLHLQPVAITGHQLSFGRYQLTSHRDSDSSDEISEPLGKSKLQPGRPQ
jgi:hypothetical protein